MQPPYTFSAAEPISVDGAPYRGKLTVSATGKLVQVIDVVGLEQYLKAVVPSEVPSNWPPEALKAQAVAARSYALANLAKGRPFDLYSDTRSQVYGGIDAESAATNAAVAATRGQVVLYNGTVADTLFFSTSGGRTASALEATGTAVPYLVSVPDPYDTLSPYHDWGPVLMDAAKAAKELKLSAPISDVELQNGPSGRVQLRHRRLGGRLAGHAHGRAGPRCARPPLDLVHVGAPRASTDCEDHDLRRCRVAHRDGARRRRRVARVEDGGPAGLDARRRAGARAPAAHSR